MSDKHFVKRDGGSFERREFKIAATKEAFRILSDGLYSDKVRAIIRELSTNARDGHIKAGNFDQTFEVHLPSHSEPWFHVKDYGCGMSHDDVMELYSTYFGTDKADELDTTGCLGLGSKSPLSKVRSFSVISRYEGIERHYIVTLNEDRLPEVNYLPEQDRPTDYSGMEIKVAVSAGDISMYRVKAQRVFQYFAEDARPRVVNSEYYELPEQKVLIEGNGWRMLEGDGRPTAIQGNVGYPIDASQMDDLNEHQQAILLCNLEIDFENGQVDFTPSREHLSYNKSTCANIKARLDEIVAEVNATIAKRFDNCKTLWEARVLAWTMFWSSDADLRHLKKLADTGQITWKNEKIAGQQLSFDQLKGVEGWSFELKRKTRGYWSDTATTTIPRRDRKEYTPRENVVWCEVDLPRGSFSRCQEHIRNNEGAIVYLVSFASPAAKQAFCNKMGLDGTEFILTSTMPKPESLTRAGGKVHRSTSLVYEHLGRLEAPRLGDHWREVDVDLDSGDGGVYVEMNNSRVLDPNGKRVDPAVVTHLIDRLASVGHEKVTVIGVRPAIAKKFRKSDDWVDIFTYVANVVKIEAVQKGLAQHIVNAETLRQVENHELWTSFERYSDQLGALRQDGVMYRLVEGLRHMKASLTKCPAYKDWRYLAEQSKIELAAEPERNIDSLISDMKSSFPLMGRIIKLKINGYSSAFGRTELTDLRHYVSLVEGTEKGLTSPEHAI